MAMNNKVAQKHGEKAMLIGKTKNLRIFFIWKHFLKVISLEKGLQDTSIPSRSNTPSIRNHHSGQWLDAISHKPTADIVKNWTAAWEFIVL